MLCALLLILACHVTKLLLLHLLERQWEANMIYTSSINVGVNANWFVLHNVMQVTTTLQSQVSLCKWLNHVKATSLWHNHR